MSIDQTVELQPLIVVTRGRAVFRCVGLVTELMGPT